MSDHFGRPTTRNRRAPGVGLVWGFSAVLLGLGLIGCATPQFAWRNPFQRRAALEPSSATTLAARVAQVQSDSEGADYLSEAEQMTVSTRLAGNLAEEPHPIVRREIAKALGEFRTPSSLEGLRLAVRDGDRDVRIAACESLAAWGTPETFRLLAEVLHSDTDVDVRLAATRLLGDSQDPSTVEALGAPWMMGIRPSSTWPSSLCSRSPAGSWETTSRSGSESLDNPRRPVGSLRVAPRGHRSGVSGSRRRFARNVVRVAAATVRSFRHSTAVSQVQCAAYSARSVACGSRRRLTFGAGIPTLQTTE